MPIKTPKFWYRNLCSKAPIIEIMTTPLAKLYQIAHNINIRIKNTKHAQVPIICIGNITSGGSGKTPTVIAINKLIKDNNIFKSPFFLSRGYGGNIKEPKLIKVQDDAKNVGDEPLLLSNHSNTIISVNRYDGAILAHKMEADLIIMDDGFQNPTLYKDLSIIVIDGKTGFGNKKTIPSGPLREPISTAFKRSSAVIIIGEDKTDITALIPKNLPIFKGNIKVAKLDNSDLSKKYIAFAGLAHPHKFKETLEENNFNVIKFHEFADHHYYSDNEIKTLIKNAAQNNAKLITTEKDFVKIPKRYQEQILCLAIELSWDNEQKIVKFLKNKLNYNKNN